MQTHQRLHSLDTVRAFALLTGILLHAAMSFMPGLASIGYPADVSQSGALQALFFFIHTFRMPLFFLIAGFFAHQMFHRTGAKRFASNRSRRILVPLVLGWLFFGPPAMGLAYVAFGPQLTDSAPAPQLAGFPFSHLWFLYYLLLFYGLTLAARGILVRVADSRGRLRQAIDRGVQLLVSAHVMPTLLAAPIGFVLYFDSNWVLFSGIASPDMGFAPQLPALVGFGTAFAFGWAAHRTPEVLLRLRDCAVSYLLLAVTLTSLCFVVVDQVVGASGAEGWIRIVYTACFCTSIWYWAFGLIGFAGKYFSTENRAIRYLADSSYWLYLAHLPLVFALQLIVRDWAAHWSIKFPFIVATAIGVLLASYHLLVRDTRVGQLINGRRHPRRSRAIPPRRCADTDRPGSEVEQATRPI